MGQLKGLTYVNLTPLDLFSVLDGTGVLFFRTMPFSGEKKFEFNLQYKDIDSSTGNRY